MATVVVGGAASLFHQRRSGGASTLDAVEIPLDYVMILCSTEVRIPPLRGCRFKSVAKSIFIDTDLGSTREVLSGEKPK